MSKEHHGTIVSRQPRKNGGEQEVLALTHSTHVRGSVLPAQDAKETENVRGVMLEEP